VVLDVPFYLEPDETEWFDLGKQAIQFGDYCELVPTSVLISAFISETLSYSVATSSVPFSSSGFASSLAKVSLLGPIFR
jgi:hypothetical protein